MAQYSTRSFYAFSTHSAWWFRLTKNQDVLGHSLLTPPFHLHCSLVCLLRIARFARAFRCTHLLAHSLTLLLPSFLESAFFCPRIRRFCTIVQWIGEGGRKSTFPSLFRLFCRVMARGWVPGWFMVGLRSARCSFDSHVVSLNALIIACRLLYSFVSLCVVFCPYCPCLAATRMFQLWHSGMDTSEDKSQIDMNSMRIVQNH